MGRTATRDTVTLDSINCSFTNAFSIPVLGFTAKPISLFIHTYCVHGTEDTQEKWGSDPTHAKLLYFPTVPPSLA